MFACLYCPPVPSVPLRGPRSDRAFEPPPAPVDRQAALLGIARAFVPRFEMPRADLLLLDVSGLERLVGPPRVIGEELRRAAADRGLPVHVAVAATRTAAWLLAHARAGLTCIEPGGEAAALAPLPLAMLQTLVRPPARRAEGRASRTEKKRNAPAEFPLAVLHRWGLATLGELAALPSVALSERLGQAGPAWQRLACGEDLPQPLVPWAEEARFEAGLTLEWPMEGLEPLSFVLGRLLEPLAVDLERHDRAAAEIHLRLGLVTKAVHERSLRLPAPIRDPRVLRTLVRLDLESHPPDAAIETVSIRIEPAPGRIVQESLLERAMPAPEQLSTLLARLTALVGQERCGTPALVDSHRPGAFAMRPFAVDPRAVPAAEAAPAGGLALHAEPAPAGPGALPGALRRFRHPLPVRVRVEHGCPAQLTVDRRGVSGGRITRCAGPWRTSGAWWEVSMPDGTPGAAARERRGASDEARAERSERGGVQGAPPFSQRVERAGSRAQRREPAAFATVDDQRSLRRATPEREARRRGVGAEPHLSWNRDEWEVALPDGVVCRIFRDRDTDRWFADGVLD